MSRARAGITLAELLVVVAIVAVLASLLYAAIAPAVRAARRTACAANLRQVGMACLGYAAEFDDLLPAEGNDGDDDPRTSPAWFHRLPAYVHAPDGRSRHSCFQCAAFQGSGAGVVFSAASPKSYKMNAWLDNDRRPRHYRLGSVPDEAGIVLFFDAVAGETGSGQLGNGTPNSVDDTRHGGAVNVLFLDGHTQATVTTPRDRRWDRALAWKSLRWR